MSGPSGFAAMTMGKLPRIARRPAIKTWRPSLSRRSQFNVLLGLCVGHDSLFFRYAEAPCTVLAVKDRLLGHNPLAAVYEYESYYRYLKQPLA